MWCKRTKKIKKHFQTGYSQTKKQNYLINNFFFYVHLLYCYKQILIKN